MNFKAATRNFVARLMLCTMAFALLAPSIGHALSHASRAPWLELCTSTGFQRLTQNGAPVDAPASPHDHGHCPFCRLQLDLPFVPMASAGYCPPSTATFALAAVPTVAVRTTTRWAFAPSRAPPAVS